MDPMTQSAQISSSQGFADGQNSAAKESKQSDKRVVLGSDKPSEGVATSLRFPSQPGSFTLGNYGSEAGPPDGQPDSPIKTSPVSERIKALEALAAKKKEPDFRSDGGFSHYRDRHHEKTATETTKSPTETAKAQAETTKSSTEKNATAVQKGGGSADLESPESPFEVLGELKQVNEFEETEEWMKAHLPPVLDFDAVDMIKNTLSSDNVTSKEEKETDINVSDSPAAFAGVPDAFMDSTIDAPMLKDEVTDEQKQPCVDEEFDLSFLPTAYMWDQQEKTGVQLPLNADSVLPVSPAPPAGFDSPSPESPLDSKDAEKNGSDNKGSTWTGELEPPEASEADSSGESDDTVIEDGVSIPPKSPDQVVSKEPPTVTAAVASNLPPEEIITPPPKSERKLMQVPTINVIETDEPNYSEEEMEMEPEVEEDDNYEVVGDPVRETPKTPEPESDDSANELPKTRPLETEFMEGYSPPSSPVESDGEYSPKHKAFTPHVETVHQESVPKPEALLNQTDVKDFSQAQPEKTQIPSSKGNEEPSTLIPPNEVDFQDNDGEWSDEADEDTPVKPFKTEITVMKPTPDTQSKTDEKNSKDSNEDYTSGPFLSKSSFMHDDIYDRQSFDYEYDASSPLDDVDKGLTNAKERFLSDPSDSPVEALKACTARNDVAEDSKNQREFTSWNDDVAFPKPTAETTLRDYPQNPYPSFQSETLNSVIDQDLKPKMASSIDEANGNSTQEQKVDSKIQQDTKADHHAPQLSSQESIDPDGTVSESADSFVEFMRECLKSRQDEEPDSGRQGVNSKNEVCKSGLPPSQPPPTMVMNLEQEQLTISALKELGSSQEEEDQAESFQSKVPDQHNVDPDVTSRQLSSVTSVPNPPCSQSNPVLGTTYSQEVEAIDEWVAEAYHLAEHVLTAILTHLSVKDLIHWRDPKKSGLVFGLSMLLLLSLAAFSVISVVSYLLLALLCVTITFRIYKSVVQAVQKSSDGHPFKALIDKDVSIPPETFRKHVDSSLTYINRALKQMSRLFLVEDLVDSLKLAVVMWLLTYVGAVFNGITILILADILLFAVPPIYEKNKTQIDQYIDLARNQINATMAKLQEKLPGAMKRSKTE